MHFLATCAASAFTPRLSPPPPPKDQNMPIHNPYEKLGEEICRWGSGHDAVNVVGTSLLAGRKSSATALRHAAEQLQGYVGQAARRQHGWTPADAADLRRMIAALRAMSNLDAFTQGYIDCALWASSATESGDSFSDEGYDQSSLSSACLKQCVKDCKEFQRTEAADLARAGDDAQNGHDFFLTRNGHGAGFWDRGYGEVGERLSKVCEAYGSVDLYLGDDGKIHCS